MPKDCLDLSVTARPCSVLSMTSTGTAGSRPGDAWFVSTRWTVVLSARDPDSPHAAAALETLCRTYWFPLYAYVRRRGHSPTDAQDLTQEFFAQLLTHNWVARADRHKGRFRSFLLMAMSRFLANEWDKQRTLKRGGQMQFVPLPLDTAETRYTHEPADAATPEQAFEKQWGLTLLEEVLQRLGEDYKQDGKTILFDTLKPCLIGSRETQPYAALAADLKMTEGAVKVAVCRLRERYRERLKAEIAHTVGAPSEVDAELRHLFRVLARG
ncbi:MAG: sigma-70 family RNA polymerase sigma factor [Verrucomicrobia bacterium]|nr:sigma-70 family RNA polymerase sigma factor [Verrucomicrobiota bacterium]